MNLQAILHTPLSKDAYMTGEKSVVIRLRAAKGDLKSATLFFGDRVCVEEPITVEAVPMKCVESDMLFDHFECSVTSDFTRICYYFKLTAAEEKSHFRPPKKYYLKRFPRRKT